MRIGKKKMKKEPGNRLRETPFIGCFTTITIVGMASIIVKRKQDKMPDMEKQGKWT